MLSTSVLLMCLAHPVLFANLSHTIWHPCISNSDRNLPGIKTTAKCHNEVNVKCEKTDVMGMTSLELHQSERIWFIV